MPIRRAIDGSSDGQMTLYASSPPTNTARYACARERRAGRVRCLRGAVFTPVLGLSVRRFLFLVSRHVNSTLGSKHGCEGGFTTPNHVHGG